MGTDPVRTDSVDRDKMEDKREKKTDMTIGGNVNDQSQRRIYDPEDAE